MDALGRHAEDVRDLLADEVRHLRGRPDRQLVVVPASDGNVRLQRAMVERGAAEDILVDDVRLAEADLHVAFAHAHVVDPVRAVLEAQTSRGRLFVAADLLVDERRAGLQRVDRIEDGRQLLILDVDELGRLRGGVRCIGDHRGDDVAHVAGLIDRDDGLILEGGAVIGEEVVRQILAGEHEDDARHGERAGAVDADDASVGVRAADASSVRHPGELDIERVRDFPHHLQHAVSLALRALRSPA